MASREIVLDTETTGLDPAEGHRLVEIGCIELVNHVATGATFHAYLNPERDVPVSAVQVHGLDSAFLADKPLFAAVAGDLLSFLGSDPLVIHNAEFDLRFLNSELVRLGQAPLSASRAIDTLGIARRRFPGAPASLDALCRRFGIDNTMRTRHGALLDAELLADVYLELVGGRQPALGLVADAAQQTMVVVVNRPPRPPRRHLPSEAELEAHRAFVAKLAAPIWLR